VVVDSEPLHERAFRQVLDEIGYGETHGIDFPAYFGKSDLVVWLAWSRAPGESPSVRQPQTG
jgi:beta-phosphoglucomutase-like phosphatase (HAD superfamily)